MLTVYSKTSCPACLKTKTLLSGYNIPYNEVLVDKDEAAKEFVLSEGHRILPQIYNGKELFVVGGYLGLVKMSEDEIKAILYGNK